MGKRRRTGQGKRTFHSFQKSTLWYWTSRWLLIHQRAWLSMRERDSRQPPYHYNLHIQPASGGSDFHNYHIRYLGTRNAEHTWLVVDAPSGRELSKRMYSFSKRRFIRDGIDTISTSLVSDILNDVGDSTIWLSLVEHLPAVLFDLYRHSSEFSPEKVVSQ